MAKGLGFALIGFFLVVVGIGAYLLGKSGISVKVAVPSPTAVATLPTPTPLAEDETAAIKKAILSKLNLDELQVTVTVGTIKGALAKGTVGGSGGGGPQPAGGGL